MSFSSRVKEELSRQMSQARHCRIAELAAMVSCCGHGFQSDRGEICLRIQTENITVARKCFTLLHKTFNINTDISVKRNAYLKKNRIYTLWIRDGAEARLVMQALKLKEAPDAGGELLAESLIVQQPCCRRAFIRGAFLASGSISDPEKFYHLEMVASSQMKAEQLRDIVNTFAMEAKIVTRKKYFVVYLKEGNQIVDLLNIMEAYVSLMELENVRILKEMRNSINRQVNCETANIHKTVSAAVSQIEAIEYIRDMIGLDGLPEGLEEIARIRLEQPEATLKELGAALDPPVGKSGVNHRLRKLKTIADSLRK
ncbi:DNA-binding protein WhiA [Cuneatibacter caecimuris]|uniref:Probable cell division protein WhiA n=1 Tax=Cuneatibacter caecimuris TaxID=1796618 RepID=A0A4Q7PNL4_9FIRM|nr:DNA-binding protein WhiA [Cuneatibacter caecimuris]RZT02474.1 hypothetical protein EV209_0593 [Cuneatibacter caecimuris]